MAFASNYRRWIMEVLTPFLGRNVVEVGAGNGDFCGLLLAARPASLTILEPSPNLYGRLKNFLPRIDSTGITEIHQSNFPDAVRAKKAPNNLDTAVYINVLEHIEDDQTELKTAFCALSPGGRILIFVPALPSLMSPMDRDVGHFRRYTMRELKAKCSAAGFKIRLARYFDVLGIAPWWLKYRLLKSRTLGAGAVRTHDRWIVPISRAIENVVTPPLGKNIILVGEKSVHT
jgi:SAM-dependent methyltransferase